MRALQLVAWQKEPELREVPVPEPGPGEVLVRVTAAGLCHSDLHVMDWPAGFLPFSPPFTLGHENAGVVAALGPGVRGFREGDAVLVYGAWGCGRCHACRRGSENLCQHGGRGGAPGLGLDGGLAEYLLVPSSRHLVPIGDLDPALAAPLTDAGLTPYHALKPSIPELVPGTSVAIIGVGGLGHLAIQLCKTLTAASVVALDVRRQALELALESGADAALVSGETSPAEVAAELGPAGAALVLDFVGAEETLALAAKLAGSGGRVAIVGAGGGTIPMGFSTFRPEVSVVAPRWGTLPELVELVALAQAGALEVHVERIALGEALAGYARMREGALVGRAVVTADAHG